MFRWNQKFVNTFFAQTTEISFPFFNHYPIIYLLTCLIWQSLSPLRWYEPKYTQFLNHSQWSKKPPRSRYFFTIKSHIFWEGHKILRNLHLTFDCMYCSQKLGEDFAKFCGLLRIYELYTRVFSWLLFVTIARNY